MKTLTLITGSNRGLGFSLLEWAQSQGHSVLSFSRRSLGERFRQQISDSSAPIFQEVLVDFSKPESYSGKLAKTLQALDLNQFERLILFNNAAVIEPVSPIGELSPELVTTAIQVNLTAPIHLCQEFVKSTKSFQGKVWIINISSGAAYRPIPSWSIYCSTKAGLKMFTDSLAMEFRNLPHWRFLNFSPGIMDTGMQAQIREIPETQFPLVGQFKDYYSQAKLSMPEKVVAKLSRYIEKIDSGKTLTSELKIDLDVSDLA